MSPCYQRHELAPGIHVDIPHEHEGVPVRTMAEVIDGHRYDPIRAVCSCSDEVQVGLRCDRQTHPEHLADVLKAAGFEPTQ